jgi:hypothetical protein
LASSRGRHAAPVDSSELAFFLGQAFLGLAATTFWDELSGIDQELNVGLIHWEDTVSL